MKWYMVIAQVNGRDFLTKVQADEKYGNKYEWHTFRECAEWEVDTYKKRGMPVSEL